MNLQPASKSLLRLISARCDMAYALEAYSLFISSQGTPASEHFFCSMVMSYGRPFTESNGIGRIQCEYPSYPDFSDPEMNARHSRLVDIRHKFLAHSSAEGTKVMIVPPNIENPVTQTTKSVFDHNVGKRAFIEPEFAAWLVEVIQTFQARLDTDVASRMQTEFGSASHSAAFEIETCWDKFKWT